MIDLREVRSVTEFQRNIKGYHNKLLQIKVKSSDIIQWIISNGGVGAGWHGAATPPRLLSVDAGANRQLDFPSG